VLGHRFDMNNTYGQDAVARANERHEKADSILFNAAGFTFNHETKKYEVTVRGLIVATFKKVSEVETFSMMHNSRMMGV